MNIIKINLKVIKVYAFTWISVVYKVACTWIKIVVSYTQKKETQVSISQNREQKKSWVECVEYHIEWMNVDHCIKKKFNKC